MSSIPIFHTGMDSNTYIANSSTLLATVTRTALTALNTSLGDSWSDWDGGDIISNGTTVIPDPEDIGEGSYILVCRPLGAKEPLFMEYRTPYLD